MVPKIPTIAYPKFTAETQNNKKETVVKLKTIALSKKNFPIPWNSRKKNKNLEKIFSEKKTILQNFRYDHFSDRYGPSRELKKFGFFCYSVNFFDEHIMCLS